MARLSTDDRAHIRQAIDQLNRYAEQLWQDSQKNLEMQQDAEAAEYTAHYLDELLHRTPLRRGEHDDNSTRHPA